MEIAAILDAKGWDVLTIEPDALVLLALQDMTAWDVGALVVSDTGDRVVGVISERDVTRALLRHGCHVLSLPVRDVMARAVPTCGPGDSTSSCLAAMIGSRHRYVPVVADGALCGIVSLADLAEHRERELEWSQMRADQPSRPEKVAVGNGRVP